MTIQCPIPKILLPVDGSENARRAVEFTGCLGRLIGKSLAGVTLLHVMPGSYLGRHSDYKDFRSEVVKQSEAVKKLRAQHIEKDIRPFMDEAERILKDEGINTRIEEVVVEGDPSHEIIRIADEGNYSTIIIARKEHADPMDFLTGVANKIVHAASKHTVYVVGLEVLRGRKCPVPKILVTVDGSGHSMKGVDHAACLAGTLGAAISGITLLKVINTDSSKESDELEKEAHQILDEAEKIFLERGVSESLITAKVRTGNPADEIVKEVEDKKYNLLIVGRKGRSALKDLILGGVSTSVLQQCSRPTIAIVSS